MRASAARPLGLLLLVALPCLLILGCGESTAELSGTITIDHQAPNCEGIEIMFVGTDGHLVTAPIHKDGSFTAVAVPAGEVKISFFYVPPGLTPWPDKDRPALPSRTKPPSTKTVPANPIPEWLRSSTTSGLTFTVQAGKPNRFDYDIKP